MAEMNLNGKVVVVTGAAGRLGRRIVERFARDGATIVALVRDEEEAGHIPFPDEAEGWAFPVDVTDEAVVSACFQQIERQFGAIDALVHTVGGWEMRPLLETTLEHWNHIVQLNLTSAFLCFREAARVMGDRGGCLIGMASGQGADRGASGQAAYSAAKAGIVRLAESVAAEFGAKGITAHAIAPSTIRFEEEASGTGVRADDVVELCLYLVAAGRAALNGATIRAYGQP